MAIKWQVLLHYNNLPCGTESGSWEATGPRPTSKKNRCLVLAVASGCPLVELFSIRPPFLIGSVIWKCLLLHSYFILFPVFYVLLYV